MNIFYLNHDTKLCAEYHVDKHVVKMILEYAQLLSTAHRVLDGTPDVGRSASGRKKTVYLLSDGRDSVLYSATHINHPSAVWARQSPENYLWLANMLIALCEEYTHRYGKTHKVERVGLCYVLLKNVPRNIGNNGFTQPTPAMPDAYKVPGDAISSYQMYYIQDKARFANWKKRSVPKWFSTGVVNNANIQLSSP
jgi:hypothetical protein